MTEENTALPFFFLDEDLNNAKDFFKTYELINCDFAKIEDDSFLKDPIDRICRYCGLSYPTVTFDKLAHTIPEFFGNHCSVSDFECDSCNKKFGDLENQLSNYIRPIVTINRVKGKKKIPTSPSSDNKTIAKKIDFFDAKDAVEYGSTRSSTENITYNEETGAHIVKHTTEPYIPYDVYKAFLKMAMGLLPHEEIKDYAPAFEILKDTRNRNFINQDIFNAYVHYVSVPYNLVGIYLFKAIDKQSEVPPLSFVFCFRQVMFQIFIPFSSDFLNKLNGRNTILLQIMPPMLPEEKANGFSYKFAVEIFNSIEKTTKDHYITIMPKDRNAKRVVINRDTNEIVEGYVFNPNNSVSFIITDDDFSIKPNELSK